VGCFCDASMRPAYDYENAALNSAQKAVNGINFFISVLGSFAYLLGSIAYIPAMNALQSGQWLFIYGSALIALSQVAKVLRSCLAQDYTVATAATTGTAHADSGVKQQQSSSSSRGSWSFQLSHALQDAPALGVDAFAGIGGVFYLVGTALSLPSNCDESDPVCAQLYATVFIAGGASFLVSGLFLNYRYFCCTVAMHGVDHNYSII
jgi:hypothetical protein